MPVLELLGIGLIIPILKIFVGTNFENYTKYLFFLTEKSKEEILVTILILLGLVYLIKFFLLKFFV